MDGLVQEVLVEVVVHVLMTESSSGSTSTHVSPVVVMVCNMKMAKVEVAESSVVTYEGRLPVVVEVVP